MEGELTTPPADSGAAAVLGLGTDVVDIDRFREVLRRTPSIVDRLYTADERALCERRRDPAPCLAARFAAKEAVLKAMGSGLGDAGFTEIEVVRAESGQPSVRLHGGAAALADGLGIGRWMLTLSHSDLVATATALALA